jgi:hypothetical protein
MEDVERLVTEIQFNEWELNGFSEMELVKKSIVSNRINGFGEV